jgi:hypothetical protein
MGSVFIINDDLNDKPFIEFLKNLEKIMLYWTEYL